MAPTAASTTSAAPSATPPLRPGRYGAIDIGTVTCRLLVADVDGRGRLSDVLRDSAICNLGEGVDRTGQLSDQAMARVEAAVGRFMEELRGLEPAEGPIPLMAIATSASRDARNAEEFRARLRRLGVRLSVIPGQREAALSFAGATMEFPGRPVVVVDSGGGSTEVIAGRGGQAPAFAHSFDVGCRRLTERFLRSDPPAPEQLQRARTWVAQEMRPFIGKLVEAGCFAGPLVAVAGTATSCVSMRDAMEVYDPKRVHGSTVSRADVDALLNRLAAMDLSQRERVVGLEPRRAPVIVGGLLILRIIMDLAQAPSFVVSELDILHGMVREMAGAAL